MDTILALKPYLETVKSHCQTLAHNELCDVICEIAQEVPPRERAGFLENLTSRSKGEEEFGLVINPSHELVSRIDSLKEEIAERQKAIDDGSYYEEYDSGYGYYDEEEPDALSEDQREELQTLFAEADHLFLSDELEVAREAYALLLDMFRSDRHDNEFYYQLYAHDVNVNWRETRSRYCRCVYELSPPPERISLMLDAMEINVNMFEFRYVPSEGNYPLLQDVFDAKTGDLPDRDEFLRDWSHALEGKTNHRAFVLFLEAINWLEGTEGVAHEVRKQRIPVGYLYWLAQLISSQTWQEVSTIAQEALENLPEGNFRAQAAEMLCLAGQETGKDALILQGKREHFFSTPTNDTLALLLEEANRQNARNEELKNALRFLTAQPQLVDLRVKALLMLGHLDEASGLVDKTKPLGWSYGGTGIGVFFGGLLTALTCADPQAETIRGLLKRYAESRYGHFHYPPTPEEPKSKAVIFQEILDGLRDIALEEPHKQDWFEVAKKIGENRIDAIVSNLHRKSYDRAAEVLGALMESFLLNDQQTQARLLLETYKNQKYKRHSAFRREVDIVLKNSKLLRTLHSIK